MLLMAAMAAATTAVGQSEGVSPERDKTGYLIPVHVCLLVAVGRGGCWLVVAATVGVILDRCLIRGTRRVPY